MKKVNYLLLLHKISFYSRIMISRYAINEACFNVISIMWHFHRFGLNTTIVEAAKERYHLDYHIWRPWWRL